ncbi:hypothetical protein F0U62_13635 [Cystobacter fuscus]|uniref:DUF5694 domain-containing protein n=1 Tax=Cystobacter fuscus TaxID=43 RepID=UPI002B30E5C4|nr:hypothetical protein F0U62_13635 [Cystobacter fuscus]
MRQWLRLPEAERRAGDGLNATLVAALENRRIGRGARGEDNLLAAPLAAALGLERVVSMDDHTADSPDADPKAAGEAIAKAWDNPSVAKIRQIDEQLHARIGDAEGVMEMYRTMNDRGRARRMFDGDFGAALEEPSPRQYGRGYVSYWETRNLRMAANIRESATPTLDKVRLSSSRRGGLGGSPPHLPGQGAAARGIGAGH